ncbi:aminopeptidase P family protein [Aureimonas flava]|uniref:Aminopeptidase P family protein n=1 Tax=Aureimonas flava TaxID=2320271 RepID=A0A3A1WEF8_9HYPH|nr:aminopeptidase P family protein [Aureimonas flava]RIX97583.1 aminopeptidase P family protein [Aureimonas flava]
MFQNFDEASDSSQSASRVERLRASLAEAGVDGFVVPRADEHQGEYIPPSADRLRWITGFTGSAGTALVLPGRAAIFVDGRYTVQVRAQVDGAVFAIESSVDTPLGTYLRRNAEGLRIGVDPWLHTVGEVASLRAAMAEAGGELVALRHNPLDRVWQDRPQPPKGAVAPHPLRHAGRSGAEKLDQIREALAKADAAATVLTDPSSVAWTFNIRGSDVPHTPLPLCFALIRRDGRPTVFIDGDKLGPEAAEALGALAEIAAPALLEPALAEAARAARVMLDPALAADRLREVVEEAGGTVVPGVDPARLPRARKNAAEIAGARRAHLRDGAAVSAFLAWLDAQDPGTVDEIGAAEALEGFRARFAEADGQPLRDLSFDTISAAGPNAALPHYRVNRQSNRPLAAGEVFLVDSGAQYEDGTTDITRTVAVGAVSDEARLKFTLVLKGMIAVSRARFPVGTRGIDLDPLARVALWRAGSDYAHGTGHGIGSYLAVHEGPQSISRRGMAVLEEGMIVSNEPGYYREGAFGIRIENLILVRPAERVAGGDLDTHDFETLTFVPIDRRMIAVDRLDAEERDWLDAYHRAVRERIGPRLEGDARVWLEAATRPLGED